MMIRFLIIASAIFYFQPLFAQDMENGIRQETVTVHKDPRFDELSEKQAELNKKAFYTGVRRGQGYRIQAVNTQNRDEANAVKAELLRRFPDEKVYFLYQSPSFRVRIGNFLTQKDAFQLRKIIAALYPQRGIYIVKDIVEYTPTEEDDIK